MKRQERFGKIPVENKLMLGTHGNTWVRGGAGASRMKRSGMFVVSLRGINQGFWSYSGCLVRNDTIFAVFYGCTRKNNKIPLSGVK